MTSPRRSTLAVATALAALLAAGCGSHSAPKPTTPPPAPTPGPAAPAVQPTPAASATVAWGEAADGLQIGLTSKPYQFIDGTPISLELNFKNLGESDMELPDAGHISQWRFEFAPKNGGATLIGHPEPCLREDRTARPIAVPKQQIVTRVMQLRCVFDTTGQGSAFLGEPGVLLSPPPGKYSVSAIYDYSIPVPWKTGAVEVEIVPKQTATVAWGAAVNGLQVGLKAARPAFNEGEPLSFTVHLRNVGDSAKGVSGIYFDDFFFQPKGGGATLRSRWLGANAAPPVKPPPPLEAGRGLEFLLTVGGEDWHFEDASQPRQEVVAAPVRFLAPGKYTVTVGSTPGRIPSGPLGIEIKPKAAAGTISWGEAVDGLQAGLAPLGLNEGWTTPLICPKCSQVYQNAENKSPGKCIECGQPTVLVSFNYCGRCADNRRCCWGCGAAKPTGRSFKEGDAIWLEVHLRNVGEGDVKGQGPCDQMGFAFVNADGGTTLATINWKLLGQEKRPIVQLSLSKGKSAAFACAVDKGGFVFTEAGTGKTLSWLRPGKYTVTASYEHGPSCAGKRPCPYWHGKVATGAVEIEIKAKGGAAAGPKISEARAKEIARTALRDALQAEGGETPEGTSGKALAGNGLSVEREVWPDTAADKKLAGKDVWIGRLWSPAGEFLGIVFLDAKDGQILEVMISTKADRQKAIQRAKEWFGKKGWAWTEPVKIRWTGYDRYDMEWAVSEEAMALLGTFEMTVSASGGEPYVHPRR